MITKATGDTGNLQSFRDDLRQPGVVFGRCCITGEWGKVAAIDLGDLSVDMPDVENGVSYEDGVVTFSKAKPIVFQNQATFSKAGLEMLMAYLDSQDNPIPAVTPELVYKWQVSYTDGSALAQFQVNPDTYEEQEINSKEIDHSRVAQLSIVPNFPNVARSEGMPTYTFVSDSGKFYKNGEEIDNMFDAGYVPGAEVIYARKVNMTFGSVMQSASLDRSIQAAHTSVLQLMGWKVGGLHGDGPGCIIGIDERGQWRPYEYIEG